MIETVPSGTILNRRYRIERVLGSGGFGHVYLALDQHLNQPSAIKEYLVSGPTGQEQLMHEANVLSHLHHPNLPAFHDAFHENGHYYVVLNYIEGNDLTDIIRNAQKHNEVVPISQIMTWILSMCDAVLFLHRQQPPVIHRDIKPDNIRITSNGTAILVDLGNAKAAAEGERTLFFIRHQGTPGYAPPEQYPGGSGTDTRSDIYALGGTLFFALTGQEPPSVSTRNQSIQQGQRDLPSLQEVLSKNPREDEPNPAKQFRLGVSKPAKPAPRHSRHLAQLATLSPIVLGQLSLIIQKAMAMRPRERYQSVADLANDLKKIIALMPGASSSYDTQPVGPPQNSYKTQPDLPMVYDMIQQGKANQSQPGVNQTSTDSATPSTQSRSNPSATPPLAQEPCPHCGGLHKVGASFCPHCGASLRGGQRVSSESSMTKTANDTQDVRQNHQDFQDARGSHAHQTSIAVSEDVTQQPFPDSPTTPPVTASSRSTQRQVNEAVSPWNATPTTASHASSSRAQSQMQIPSNSTRARASLNIGLILVIILAIILLLLIVILVILLVHHAQGIIAPSPLSHLYHCRLSLYIAVRTNLFTLARR